MSGHARVAKYGCRRPSSVLFSVFLVATLPQEDWWPLEPGEVSRWEVEWSDVFTGIKDLRRSASGSFVDHVLRDGDAGFECLRWLRYAHKSGSGERESELKDASYAQFFDGDRRGELQARRTRNGRGGSSPMVRIPSSLYPDVELGALEFHQPVVREATPMEMEVALLYGDKLAFRETWVEGEGDDEGLWVLQRRLDADEALRAEHAVLGTYLLHAYDVDFLIDPEDASAVGYRRHVRLDGWVEEGEVAFRTIRLEAREVERQTLDDDHWRALVDEADAWWSVREAASIDAETGLDLLDRYRVSRGDLLLPGVADALAGEIRSSEQGRKAYARRQETLRELLGSEVPEVELTSLESGTTASLHELIDGKVAYLTFWGVG